MILPTEDSTPKIIHSYVSVSRFRFREYLIGQVRMIQIHFYVEWYGEMGDENGGVLLVPWTSNLNGLKARQLPKGMDTD